MGPNKVNLIYQIEGDFNEGIDVKELSPMLLSLGELIQKSNALLDPQKKELAIRIKPFEKGSFIVDVVINATSNYQQLVEFINQQGVRDVKELLEWIGLVKGVVGFGGLIGLIKWLNGKPKSVLPQQDGGAIVINYKDESKNVAPIVFALFSNVDIQQSLSKSVGATSKIQGATGLKTFLNDEPDKATEVSKEDLEHIAEYEEPYISSEERIVNQATTTVILNPKRGDYAGAKGPYTFVQAGDQNVSFTKVNILDDNFTARLEAGEIRLYHRDTLKAELKTTVKERLGRHSITYEIVRVLNYISFREQDKLFTSPGTDNRSEG
jgi:hypothetical protein